MKRITITQSTQAFALGLMLSSTSEAAELAPLSSAELHRQCLAYATAPESSDGESCAAYVRGFIEGSPLVQLRLVPDDAKNESFTERAFRTRYGSRPGVDPRYCVDGSLTVANFIIQMLVQAERSVPRETEDASALIFSTLNRFHRCSAQEIEPSK